MRVGIAGLGKMGAAMAARLVETGLEVAVWNRTRARADASGLPVADTPRELAARSDVVMTTLLDGAALTTLRTPMISALATDVFPFLHLRKWENVPGLKAETPAVGSIILALATGLRASASALATASAISGSVLVLNHSATSAESSSGLGRSPSTGDG